MSDDLFDSILSFESSSHQHGIQRGHDDGMKQGYYEGQQLGIRKGTELGSEIGFYMGCVATWTACAQQYPERFTTRAHLALSRLTPLLSSFNMSNPQDEHLFESLALIRSRFKTLIVMMGVHAYFKRQEEQQQGTGTGTSTSTPKPDMTF